MMYIARSAATIPSSPADLGGLSVSVMPHTSFEHWLLDIDERPRARLIYADSEEETIGMVREGRADITLSDSDFVLTRLHSFPDLAYYPVGTNPEILNWAVAKDDEVLAGILDKCISYLKEVKAFDTAWYRYYGSSFEDYLELLSIDQNIE